MSKELIINFPFNLQNKGASDELNIADTLRYRYFVSFSFILFHFVSFGFIFFHIHSFTFIKFGVLKIINIALLVVLLVQPTLRCLLWSAKK